MGKRIKFKSGGVLLFGRYFVDEDLLFGTWFAFFLVSMGLFVVGGVFEIWILTLPLFVLVGVPVLSLVCLIVRYFFRRWRNVFRGVRSEDGTEYWL